VRTHCTGRRGITRTVPFSVSESGWYGHLAQALPPSVIHTPVPDWRDSPSSETVPVGYGILVGRRPGFVAAVCPEHLEPVGDS